MADADEQQREHGREAHRRVDGLTAADDDFSDDNCEQTGDNSGD